MRTLTAICIFGFLGLVAGDGFRELPAQQPAAAVDLKIVRYGDLADIVRANKGKVILIDFWGTTCVPCRRSFHHTVEMYNKYRDKGFVVLSVSTFEVDPESDMTKRNDVKKRALEFLQSKNAVFTNVILDEPTAVIGDKLRITSIPCLYVFNRDGQWTQFIGDKLRPDENHRHLDVENYVKYCLEQPAKGN